MIYYRIISPAESGGILYSSVFCNNKGKSLYFPGYKLLLSWTILLRFVMIEENNRQIFALREGAVFLLAMELTIT